MKLDSNCDCLSLERGCPTVYHMQSKSQLTIRTREIAREIDRYRKYSIVSSSMIIKRNFFRTCHTCALSAIFDM